jgi:hypothetical protein
MTLNDIRKKSGLLLIVIGAGMLGFIFMDLMNSGTSLFQKEQNTLLQIDGDKLTFTNFEKELEENINIKFLSNLGTVNITESQRNTERDLLWDQKMKEILFIEKFEDSGIDVGVDETWDLISGEITGNQAPLFGYFFRDQTESGQWNQYSPELIKEWIDMGVDNPQWFRYLFFEKNTTRDRAFLKYYNAVKKGIYATAQDAKTYYTHQTQSMNGKYMYIACDNSVSGFDPSEKEIKQYYKNNKENFSNSPHRKITYFIFDLLASNEDRTRILQEMKELILDQPVFNKRLNQEEIELGFMNTDNLKNFISEHGDNRYEVNMFSQEEFNKIEDTQDVSNGIIHPYISDELCTMGRIINQDSDSVGVVYLEREIYASDQTLNEIYSQVFEFIDKNKIITDIKKVSEGINNKPRTVTLEKMDESVPGLGVSRQIVRWAFNSETNLNETNFFDLQDQYIVAFVSQISEEETKPISEVYDEIVMDLRKHNISKKFSNDISQSESASFNDLAKEFGVTVKNVSQLRMNSDIFGNEGYNPAVVGAFFAAQSEKISSPFIGENGVFVFYKETNGGINYPSEFSRYQALVERTNHATIDLSLVELLKEDKNIIDNRFNFY